MFDWTKLEKKVPHHKLTIDENKWKHKRFIRLESSTFSRDTDVVQHSRYTGSHYTDESYNLSHVFVVSFILLNLVNRRISSLVTLQRKRLSSRRSFDLNPAAPRWGTTCVLDWSCVHQTLYFPWSLRCYEDNKQRPTFNYSHVLWNVFKT